MFSSFGFIYNANDMERFSSFNSDIMQCVRPSFVFVIICGGDVTVHSPVRSAKHFEKRMT